MTNYPTSLDQLSEEERTKFHLSAELDFDLSALIGKVKVVSSLCTSVDDFRFVKKILADLHESIDYNYKIFNTGEHNEQDS